MNMGEKGRREYMQGSETIGQWLRLPTYLDTWAVVLFLLMDGVLFVVIVSLVRWLQRQIPDQEWACRWGGDDLPYLTAIVGCGVGGAVISGRLLHMVGVGGVETRRRPPVRRP